MMQLVVEYDPDFSIADAVDDEPVMIFSHSSRGWNHQIYDGSKKSFPSHHVLRAIAQGDWHGTNGVGRMIIDFQANPYLAAFMAGYEECALWSSVGDDGESLAGYEVASETQDEFEADCAAFYMANKDLIHCDDAPLSNDHQSIGDRQAAMAGHDFWLTRNGHGAGFWDGDWPDDIGEQLTAAAKKFTEVDLYVGDDGKVYR